MKKRISGHPGRCDGFARGIIAGITHDIEKVEVASVRLSDRETYYHAKWQDPSLFAQENHLVLRLVYVQSNRRLAEVEIVHDFNGRMFPWDHAWVSPEAMDRAITHISEMKLSPSTMGEQRAEYERLLKLQSGTSVPHIIDFES